MLQTRLAKFIYPVALLLVIHLTQTETLSLKKAIKWDGQKEKEKEASAWSGLRQGIIAFGEGLKNASWEGDADYQADLGDFFKGQEGAFNRMPKSLGCDDNYLRFKAYGRDAMSFALDQYPPLSWDNVPSSCGYSMRRNPFGFFLRVPYSGCGIAIQDGCYSLPLTWNRIPVTLKCPQPEDLLTTAPPTLPPIFTLFPPQEPTQEPVPEIPPHILQLLLLYWYFFSQSQLTPPTPPQVPVPHDPWVQYPWNLLFKHLLQTTTAPPPHSGSQSLSNDMLLSLILQNHLPQSPSPQTPFPQVPSDLTYLLQKYKYPGQSPQVVVPQSLSNDMLLRWIQSLGSLPPQSPSPQSPVPQINPNLLTQYLLSKHQVYTDPKPAQQSGSGFWENLGLHYVYPLKPETYPSQSPSAQLPTNWQSMYQQFYSGQVPSQSVQLPGPDQVTTQTNAPSTPTHFPLFLSE